MPGDFQVVGGLEPEPEIRARAKVPGETQRRFGLHRPALLEDLIDAGTGDAERAGEAVDMPSGSR